MLLGFFAREEVRRMIPYAVLLAVVVVVVIGVLTLSGRRVSTGISTVGSGLDG